MSSLLRVSACVLVCPVFVPAPPGVFLPVQYRVSGTGKKTPGGAGTHMGHTGHTGARGQTDHTDEPHNHPPKPKDTNPHEDRDRFNSRKNSRKPGVDRSPRPTQKRPPPTLLLAYGCSGL